MRSGAGGIEEFAAAKVNLALRVTGRRADGYHTLDSLVVHCSDVGDTLHLARSTGTSLSVEGPFSAELLATDNLCTRAADAWSIAAGRACDVEIRLDKRLPLASGIGGGSTDAAAVLRGLRRLHGWPPEAAHLIDLARTLGADVPMCLEPVPSMARGIGDELSAVAMQSLHLVLVNPGVSVSTPQVFAARRGRFGLPLPPLPDNADTSALAVWLGNASNDLEPATRGLIPDVDRVLRALMEAEGTLHAGMSGSGATCYALHDSRASADAAEKALSHRHPHWWVRATTTFPGVCP